MIVTCQENRNRKDYKSHDPLLLRTEERSGLIHPWLHFRKLPGRNVYAQMHNEKEQEMTSPVSHSEDTQNIIQGEEFIDDDLDSQTLGNHVGIKSHKAAVTRLAITIVCQSRKTSIWIHRHWAMRSYRSY